MGVRGLATFISNNASDYLQTHRLQDCTLVVDGNNLASQLDFFEKLKACGIESLVLFDGGYEARKLPTVWNRLKGKIQACSKVNPANQTRKNVFPLFHRETFKLVLSELGVQMAQCDFEADEEIAALAQTLQCPVLSLDSDFFMLDVLYIPFDQLLLSNDGAKFLSCRVYQLKRFLNMFGGLQPEMMPLMATLLGNDYVTRNLFDPFFAQIKKLGSKRMSLQQRKIAGLIQWLRRENPDSALQKILHFIKLNERERVRVAIERASSAYSLPHCAIDKYFDLSLIRSTTLQDPDTPPQLCDMEEDETESAEEAEGKTKEYYDDENEEEGFEVTDEQMGLETRIPEFLPEFFIDAYRRCQMPPVFMDLCTLRIYIMQPQKEDFSERESASAVSLPIVRLMTTILLGTNLASQVLLVTRRFKSPVKEPLFKEGQAPLENAPLLHSIPDMSLEDRRAVLLAAVGVNLDLLLPIPSEWRLFFLAVLYWAKQPEFPITDRLVHAVVLSMLLQTVVAPVRKGTSLSNLVSTSSKELKHLLANLSTPECKLLYGEIYSNNSFSKPSGKCKNAYDISLVHSLAQLQSLILTLHQLNQLLLQPFQSAPMHKLYSGTMMYNVANSLQSRHDPMAYVKTCLSKGPNLFALHAFLADLVLTFAPDTKKIISKKKSHPNKTKKDKVAVPDNECLKNSFKDESEESGCENEYWDPNNKFALLRAT
ncbi:Hypothetical predicted protein [Cloeon dipterum]|uniref:Asteroid domain-containing protein n=1 Tax=Cloeon dipterum TaxID=197152 RepID=A0A8S1BZS2_9INSE|nr:Hypothetical predicted protein [Cloeon dipterum]